MCRQCRLCGRETRHGSQALSTSGRTLEHGTPACTIIELLRHRQAPRSRAFTARGVGMRPETVVVMQTYSVLESNGWFKSASCCICSASGQSGLQLLRALSFFFDHFGGRFADKIVIAQFAGYASKVGLAAAQLFRQSGPLGIDIDPSASGTATPGHQPEPMFGGGSLPV